ncbi:hypothetical protein Pla110_37210 [Polystyrenella longa]|uniref:Bacterial type II secretion system protein G n=1 Tax=Polystyrenella longa TaxID=2528007 RepID=A0A518CRW7_9PLAN|nr:hypothetical protein [Polystyrenella longa]QDU81969.1 hypothetical protein Pla110_37210 [Polystyrenella longa]
MLERFFKSRWVKYPFYLLFSIFLFVPLRLIYYHVVGQKIIVSKETTYLVEPVLDPETLNFVKALNTIASEGVTPQNNAAVPLMEAFGPGIIPAENRDDFFNELEMPVPPEEGDYLVLLEQYESEVLKDEIALIDQFDLHQEEASRRPWNRDEFPDISDWIDRNEIPLQVISEGMAREHFYVPILEASDSSFGRLFSSQLPVQQSSRAIGSLLNARSIRELEEEKVDAAIDDFLTVHRLASHIKKNGSWVINSVGMSLEAIVFEGEQALLSSGKLDLAQVILFQHELNALPDPPTLVEIIGGTERASSIDQALHFTQSSAAQEQNDDEQKRFQYPASLDINYLLRKINQKIDHQVVALGKETYRERLLALEKLEEELFQVSYSKMLYGTLTRTMVADLLVDSVLLGPLIMGSSLHSSWGQTYCRRRMLSIGLELEKYRLKQGNFPESLDPLKANLPAETFLDYFSDQPLLYQKTERGYVLYSIGQNLIDDGGEPRGEPAMVDGRLQRSTTDDIVLKIELKRKPAIAE